MERHPARPVFVTCDFNGVWKVGKLDPEAPFGLPKEFVGEFATQDEAEAFARECEEATTPGWVKYAEELANRG